MGAVGGGGDRLLIVYLRASNTCLSSLRLLIVYLRASNTSLFSLRFPHVKLGHFSQG